MKKITFKNGYDLTEEDVNNFGGKEKTLEHLEEKSGLIKKNVKN